jgi:shikimate kinase
MMGCGKTAVGEKLAALCNRDFIDLDRYIEQKTVMTVNDIFSERGERYFRQLESAALKEISGMGNAVVSCGGGIVLDDGNIDIMKKSGRIIWLKRGAAETMRTLDTATRPLLKTTDRFPEIFDRRKELYEKAGDVSVDKTGSVTEAAEKIRSLVCH